MLVYLTKMPNNRKIVFQARFRFIKNLFTCLYTVFLNRLSTKTVTHGCQKEIFKHSPT